MAVFDRLFQSGTNIRTGRCAKREILEMVNFLRRLFAPQLVFALIAAPLAGCLEEAYAAASSTLSDVIRMGGGNTKPYYGRDDGFGVDVDNYGPGLVINGEVDQMFNSSLYVGVAEEFLGARTIQDIDTADAASDLWSSDDTATAGCPAVKADYDNGGLELLLDNGNEVGDCDLNWGNQRNIDSDTEPFCIFRITYQTAPAAADSLAWGLYADQNDLISGFDTFAAFSVAGADNNLDVQSDDATTDVNATDSTVDMTAGTMLETMVSLNSMHGRTVDDPNGASATDVHFFYRTSTGGAWTQILAGTTFSVGADLAMQPFVHIEKTSGTTVPDLLVDRVACYWQRE